MGMESYFINLLPEGVMPVKFNGANVFSGKSGLTVLKFIDSLQHLGICSEVHPNKIIMGNAIILNVAGESEYIREITLEGCLSWYIEGLSYCYKIVDRINTNIFSVTIHHPKDIMFPPVSEEQFVQAMRGVYDVKYERFISEYGEMNVKIPPGHEFYKYYQKNKKGFLNKMIGRFFG